MNRRWRWLLPGLMIAVLPLLSGADVRTYVSGYYALHLDGASAGMLRGVDGGNVYAEVISEASGATYYARKHIGQPKYEDFAIQVGPGMSKGLYEWVAASWKQNYQRKNGAIIQADYNYAAKSQREFFNALITETTIPAMDGASKEPAYITVKFAPEYTRVKKADGKPVQASAQKTWLPANFRFELTGLDTSKVSKIDSFTIKQTAVTDDIGDARDYLKEPGKLEFPNLKVTLAESAAQPWYDWHEDFVIKGNNGDSQEKNGALVLLDNTRTAELARIKLYNVGILAVRPVAATGTDTVARVQVELYVERMEFAVVEAAGYNLQATVGPGSAVLSWSAPTTPAGKTIKGYSLFRGASATGLVQAANQLNDFLVTGYSLPDKAAPGTYYYAVVVYYTDGTAGTPSAALKVTIP